MNNSENAYYICVIVDLFSRMVVGYKIGKTNSTQLVNLLENLSSDVRKAFSLFLKTIKNTRNLSDFRCSLAGALRLELRTRGFGDHCSTN